MKYTVQFYIILSGFCLSLNLNAGPVITMFLEPYPELPQEEQITHMLKKPGKRAKQQIRTLSSNPMVRGIFATYGGSIVMSDANGQITFERKHANPEVYLLITHKITPIMMAGNTIHHWEIEQNTDARMYRYEQAYDDSTKLHYWNVTPVPIPQDRHIPKEAITLLAKPKHVYVPEGITITQPSANLLLPSIFIKKGIKTNTNALYILNVRQFFGVLHPAGKKDKGRYMWQVGM